MSYSLCYHTYTYSTCSKFSNEGSSATMVRSLEEIQADKKRLAEEEKEALKAHKKDAIAEVKKLIVEYKLTKGDIRGKAIKQLMGE